MKADFSRGKCPVCGLPVKFRQNKNGILYTYCDHGHHAKLGRLDSNEATEAINAGRPWNNGVIYLYPLEQKGTNNGTARELGTITPISARTDNFGRGDGQPAASAGSGHNDRLGSTGSGDRSDDSGFGLGFI